MHSKVSYDVFGGRIIAMKSIHLYSLIVLCCAQPALAQQFESDEQWQQQAAQQLNPRGATRPQQPGKKTNIQAMNLMKQPGRRQSAGAYSLPARHNVPGAGYGYRPQRGSIGSGYGSRPSRAQLMPQGYSQEMLQQKMQKLQQMQQMLGGAGGAAAGAGAGGGMGALGQQQGKPNMLQMLMGGGAQQPQQQQQTQSGQPQFNRGELLKSLFGGGASGGGSEQTGE